MGTTWDWVQTSRELECTENPKSKQKIAESKSWKRKGIGYRQAEMDRVRVYRGSKTKTKVHQTKSLLFSNEGACLGVIEEPGVLLWTDGIGMDLLCSEV